MVKKILTPIIIFAVIISGIVVSKIYMNHETEAMSALLEKTEEYAKAGDEEKANESIVEFKKKWQTHREIACTFIRHNEIDIANEAETKLQALLKAEDKADFFAELDTLQFQIKHINEIDKYTLDNIF